MKIFVLMFVVLAYSAVAIDSFLDGEIGMGLVITGWTISTIGALLAYAGF